MSDERKIIIEDRRHATDEYEFPMYVKLENASREEPELIIYDNGRTCVVTLLNGMDEIHEMHDGEDYSWETQIFYDLDEMPLESLRSIGRLFIAAADLLEKETRP